MCMESQWYHITKCTISVGLRGNVHKLCAISVGLRGLKTGI
jgi:hypothetical protein